MDNRRGSGTDKFKTVCARVSWLCNIIKTMHGLELGSQLVTTVREPRSFSLVRARTVRNNCVHDRVYTHVLW